MRVCSNQPVGLSPQSICVRHATIFGLMLLIYHVDLRNTAFDMWSEWVSLYVAFVKMADVNQNGRVRGSWQTPFSSTWRRKHFNLRVNYVCACNNSVYRCAFLILYNRACTNYYEIFKGLRYILEKLCYSNKLSYVDVIRSSERGFTFNHILNLDSLRNWYPPQYAAEIAWVTPQ